MGLPAIPAVVWGGIWVAGAIGARIAARQIIRTVVRRAAQQAANRAAQSAMQTAIVAGTLAPEDFTGIDRQFESDQDRADALARDLDAACAADPARCEACQANRGAPVPRAWNMSNRARSYQQFISGFPRNVEYRYNGVDFDGFWRPVCTLIEAKDNYAFFLRVTTSDGLFSDPSIDRVAWRSGMGDAQKAKFLAQATSQKRAATPTPPVMLQWHCAQIALTIILTQEFQGLLIPVIYTPNPGQTDPHGEFIGD